MPSTLKPMDQLPLKHQLFIPGFLEYKGDRSKAARHAGYSAKTAGIQAQQLYQKLIAYIEPLTREVVKAYALSAEQVVQGLSLLASSDIGNYCSWNKKNEVIFKDMEDLTPHDVNHLSDQRPIISSGATLGNYRFLQLQCRIE